ncbi:MAG TPA: NAD-glutamate dehydrogenase, partial [Novosphingobium sp.]|nr:NAD-glutamate dehydrogenase [Novosphingobium sp.]
MTSNSALREALARRLAADLLPGDAPFGAEGLAEAAAFVLTAAASRKPGEPALAIDTVSPASGRRFMRIAVINDDMPFLVDSIATTVAAQGLAIDRLVHPVLAVRRDAKGAIEALPEGQAAGERRESMVYLETQRGDARQRRALEQALKATLGDVRAAVADWPAMQTAMAADADACPDGEGAALLRWFKEGMLTQLGHVVRQRDGSQHGALGVCRASTKALLGPVSYERAFAWFETGGARVPLVVKSNQSSLVH